MPTWTPDFCSTQPPCAISIEPDWSAPREFVRLCSHHAKLRDDGLKDDELFAAIVQSCRVKEAARAEVKKVLGLDKEIEAPRAEVQPDGSFKIVTGAKDAALLALKTAVDAEVAKVDKPVGVSVVVIE